MSHKGSPGRDALLAGAIIAVALVVCAHGIGHGQVRSQGPPAAVAGPAATPQQSRHPARLLNPEKEFEEALEWRKKFSKRDLERALRLLIDSAQRFASQGRTRQAVAARLEAGDVFFMMSRYPQALAAYRRALTMSEGHVDRRCAALSRIARTYANIGRIHDSQQYSDQAVSVCMTLSDKKAEADALEAQGETRLFADMADAIASFTRSRELASQAGDRDGEGLATMMLSEAVDDHQQANRLAWSALAGFVESGNEYSAARAHLKLGYFASAEGDFEVARCHCESALPVFQRIADKDYRTREPNMHLRSEYILPCHRHLLRRVLRLFFLNSRQCKT